MQIGRRVALEYPKFPAVAVFVKLIPGTHSDRLDVNIFPALKDGDFLSGG
jgi:hypothetical protein